jgi:hypothetical protein
MTTFIKDPNAQLDFSVDWSDWLTGEEIISASSWTIPDGLTLVSQSYTNTTATVFLSGGTVGRSYLVQNRITTNNATPRIDDRSFEVYVENR